VAENKTKPTGVSVDTFLQSVPDEKKRQDSYAVLELMRSITGMEPVMWGSAIVGFGRYHYRYPTGHEGDSPLLSFSPRKDSLTLYLMPGVERYAPLLEKLGKYKTGKGCLYIRRLEDVDQAVLRELLARTVEDTRQMYPDSPAE